MLTHYLVLAVKVLLRRKFFTFISLFGISFTLLVLTVVAALFDHSFGPGAQEPLQDRTLYAGSDSTLSGALTDSGPNALLYALDVLTPQLSNALQGRPVADLSNS